jgi:hypothetical protein
MFFIKCQKSTSFVKIGSGTVILDFRTEVPLFPFFLPILKILGMEDLYDLPLSNSVFRKNCCSESHTSRMDVNDTSPVGSKYFTGARCGADG